MSRTLLALSLVLLPALASADFSPQQIPVPLDKVFVPIGFDDNDNSQVTVAGEFPATCYKVGPSHVRVDSENRKVFITQTAYKYSGICLRVVVPFAQNINLGVVASGDYTLVDEVSGRRMGTLPVTRSAGPEPDDYLYAPVADADIVTEDKPAKTHTLRIKGTFTTRCMRLKEVRVLYYPDVIVAQPIAEPIGDFPACAKEMVRFSHEMPLNPALTGGYLLHVRAMNGQAINKIVDTP